MTNNTENKKINIIHNNNTDSIETASILEKKLKEEGFLVPKGYNYDAFLNICIGGDGAFLRTVHNFNFPNIPFIGVNTGHLGFFQELCPDNLDDFVKALSDGNYDINEIFLVEAQVCTRNSCIELIGLNEIVIKGINSKTIHLNICIDDTYLEKFSGDGILISTPIGSTAYNFSSGGSLVFPSLEVLQVTPLSPINSKVYRSLTTSVIVPNDMVIKLHPEYRDENSILIVVDGKQYKYDNIIEINFKVSTMKINKLTLGHDNFWSNVRNKFL
ncbi:MAG: NAD(+)/NADH kinase [Firmicutes bacterium]|nr:NAD(+)/NADH kinase [Bacillota bacterium]